MAIEARYVHTNLIAQDWRRLVEFYEQVFGCTPVTPESTLSGQWVEKITGVTDAEIRVVHLCDCRDMMTKAQRLKSFTTTTKKSGK